MNGTNNGAEKPVTFSQVATYSYETLQKLGLVALASVTKDYVSRVNDIAEERRDLAETLRDGFQPFGKVLAAAQASFDAELAAGTLPKGTSFASWFKDQTDKDLDGMGRAEQCRRVFVRLVVSGKLPESDYDNVATDWLFTTSKIIDLVQKRDGNLDGTEIAAVIKVLTTRPKKGAKELRTIKNALQGIATSENGVTFTLDVLKDVIAAAHQARIETIPGTCYILPLVMPAVKGMAPEHAEMLWKQVGLMLDVIELEHKANIDAWVTKRESADIERRAEEWVNAHAANLTGGDRAACKLVLKEMAATAHRWPATIGELDAWVNAQNVSAHEPAAAAA